MPTGYRHSSISPVGVTTLFLEPTKIHLIYKTRGSMSFSNPTQSELWDTDLVAMLEANLDDITGEHLASVMGVLMDHGALDVWATPIVMKKGRPAHTLHCLCRCDEESRNKLIKLMFQHSTTLGIRIHSSIQRAKLERSTTTVTTSFASHPVRVKMSKFKNTNEIVSSKAEFEDCKSIMDETGIPVKVIAEEAIETAKRQLPGTR
jgi:pyridinium-3,5-bisthiocarboxylic acid mononucleotide nickel chelatase